MAHTINQRSLAKGEWSPDLYGRSDLQGYTSSVKLMRNFYVNKRGVAKNDPGTQFINFVKDSTKQPKLVPFKFSEGQQYVCEFGDMYVHRN